MKDFEFAGVTERQDFISSESIKSELTPFFDFFSLRPIQDNSGGVGLSGSFSLYMLLKKLKPAKIVESGVWRGHTTWLIEQLAPDAQLWCFDPRVVAIKECFWYISDKAKYSAEDFGSVKFREHLSGEGVLAFFDDHQDTMERLATCFARGIRDVVLDDNYFVGGGHKSLFQYCRDGGPIAAALKEMIEFVYVFPPVFKWQNDPADIEPIFPESAKADRINYYNDRSGYRYMTYVRLKASA